MCIICGVYLFIYFSFLLCCLCASKARHRLGCENVSWCLETSLFKSLFPGQDSLPGTELPPYLLCLFFHLIIFFPYLFLKPMICFAGCLMFSASIQKLFCGIYSALKCSLDEFLREKVISPSQSYSSAILGPPPFLQYSNGYYVNCFT